MNNSKEPEPERSDQQIVQLKTEYRTTDRMVGIGIHTAFLYDN